jgi:hypothetical protein
MRGTALSTLTAYTSLPVLAVVCAVARTSVQRIPDRR